MFFNISKSYLNNYPNHWRLGNFYINADNGWCFRNLGSRDILYKGYADADSMDQLLEQIVELSEPQLTGNFCVLVYENDTIKIKTDRYRSFPIYIGQEVNNLVPSERTAWSDSMVTVNEDFSVTEHKFDLIGNIDTDPISMVDALDVVTDILDQKTRSFVKHNHLPIRAFLSGGVDSMLVYSFLQKHTDRFKLIRYNHVDWDYFWIQNSGAIRKHWAYNQIHHWTDHCVLTSGTPGDEFMMRNPATGDLLLKHHGVLITDLLSQPQWKDCLHHEYFCLDKNQKIFQSQQAPTQSLEQLHWKLCNIVINDWQHWHLGNTLTWTPLRDLDIFKTLLRLPIEDLVGQIMNSDFSIELIERNSSGLSVALSNSKNHGNVLANLVNVI